MKISRGKFAGLNDCSNQHGVIAALAVDHRGNLLQAIAEARGVNGQATAEDMLAFKSTVARVLTPYASALLLDPEYGLGALSSRVPGTGAMLAYEKSGYDYQTKGRLPDLLPTWSVLRLVEAGAQAIKILLYYNPVDEPSVNRIKQVYIERIGAECQAQDIPFFLEPLVYDDAPGNEQSLAFARKKPAYVAQTIAEFTQARYAVDVLKVELPVNPVFVADTRACTASHTAYTRQEALEHFRTAANVATKPLIYLSAGVSNEAFCEMLELAAEAGTQFAGVLCGRATWQDGIAIYAREGISGLERWLAADGARNIEAINKVLAHCARPWWDAYGGRDKIEIVGNE